MADGISQTTRDLRDYWSERYASYRGRTFSTTTTFTVRKTIGGWVVVRRIDGGASQSIGGYFETEAGAEAHALERLRAARVDE